MSYRNTFADSDLDGAVFGHCDFARSSAVVIANDGDLHRLSDDVGDSDNSGGGAVVVVVSLCGCRGSDCECSEECERGAFEGVSGDHDRGVLFADEW